MTHKGLQDLKDKERVGGAGEVATQHAQVEEPAGLPTACNMLLNALKRYGTRTAEIIGLFLSMWFGLLIRNPYGGKRYRD